MVFGDRSFLRPFPLITRQGRMVFSGLFFLFWRGFDLRGTICLLLSFYNLRHAYAKHLVMRGVHIRTLQELLGHKTLAMTQRYCHLAPEQLQNAVKLLDGVIGEWERIFRKALAKDCIARGLSRGDAKKAADLFIKEWRDITSKRMKSEYDGS